MPYLSVVSNSIHPFPDTITVSVTDDDFSENTYRVKLVASGVVFLECTVDADTLDAEAANGVLCAYIMRTFVAAHPGSSILAKAMDIVPGLQHLDPKKSAVVADFQATVLGVAESMRSIAAKVTH